MVRSSCIVFACIVAAVAAQSIPDARDAGYQMNQKRDATIPSVTVEVFGDFQCPDTKALWFTILHPLLDEKKYAQGVTFTFRPFPLVYHRSGFTSSQAVRVVMDYLSKQGANEPMAFVKTADAFFSGQGKFQTDVTVGMSNTQIFEDVFVPIATTAGMTNKTEFLAGMADEQINSRCRVAWHTGCTRGIYGTPMLAVNGVVNAQVGSWNLTQWRSYLDSQLPQGKAIV